LKKLRLSQPRRKSNNFIPLRAKRSEKRTEDILQYHIHAQHKTLGLLTCTSKKIPSKKHKFTANTFPITRMKYRLNKMPAKKTSYLNDDLIIEDTNENTDYKDEAKQCQQQKELDN
jgi:hypothetical protein